MAVEHHSYPNSDWVRFETHDDKGTVVRAANFVGIKEFDTMDGENGTAIAPVIVEGCDAEGVATIARFKDIKSASELIVKVKKTNPTLPTGALVTQVSSSTVGQQPAGQAAAK